METTEVDLEELYFLLLHFLADGPCQQAAASLQQEALVHHLLPSRTDFRGGRHALTYNQLKSRYPHITPHKLHDILKEALRKKQTDTSLGLTSLLQRGQAISPAKAHHSGVAKWLRPPCEHASITQKVVLRHAGWSPAVHGTRRLLQPRQYVEQLRHQRTLRGHRFAVYCIAFSRCSRYVVTGSDDALVKIWSVEAALLLATCRGHEAEITDLKINADNTIVASSSNDATIRCWDLQHGKLGHQVSVLLGHTGPVTFLDFCEAVPDALLSSSIDGTCRIWGATHPSSAMHILEPNALFGLARGASRRGAASGPEHIVRATRSAVNSAAPAAADAENSQGEVGGEQEGTHLLVCSFSEDGEHIFAGCNDCCVYIWHWDLDLARDQADRLGTFDRLDIKDPNKLRYMWSCSERVHLSSCEPSELCKLQGHRHDVLLLQVSHDSMAIATGSKDGCVRIWRRQVRGRVVGNMWASSLVLSCPIDDEAAAAARRRRRAPPNPSINQVAWTTDDAKVLAAISDDTIAVWDAHSGDLEQRLRGHTFRTHVLECHPLDPRLVMSAGYDGQTIVWDLAEGRALARFSTQDTRPLGGRWCDPLQLVDGHWSRDGSSIIVADVAGQWHLYSMGHFSFPSRGLYDQFFSSDYAPVLRDVMRFVLDAETQQPPHLRQKTDLLTDFMGDPYPPVIQTAFRSGQLGLLSDVELAQELRFQPGMLPNALIQAGPTLTAAAWQAQEEGASEEAAALAMARAHERMTQADLAEAHAAAQQPREAEPHGRDARRGGTAAPAAGSQAAGRAQAEQLQALSRAELDEDSPYGFLSTSDSEAEEHRRQPQRMSMRQQERALRSRARRTDDEDAHHDDNGDTREARAARRAEMREQRQLELMTQASMHGPRRGKRQRRSGREEAEAEYTSTSDEQGNSDVEEGDEVALRRYPRRTAGARQQARRPEEDARGAMRRERAQRLQRRQRSSLHAQALHAEGAASKGRPLKAYSWLQVWEQTPGLYVPQVGDRVVYLQQGHKLYYDRLRDKRRGPWDTIVSTAAETRGQRMRPAEPARVVSLKYAVGQDADADTMAIMRLVLDDTASPLAGREFEVEMPPPHHGQAEFVMLRARFEAAVARAWRSEDACKIYYPDEEEAGEGQWWSGSVAADMLEPEEAQAALQDPWSCEGLWERYVVHWAEPPDTDPSQHSPWELFDEGMSAEEMRAEAPSLDMSERQRLQAALKQLMQTRKYQLFCKTPGPDAVYATGDEGVPVWYTAVVPLPAALPDLMQRLRSNYYRQVEALQHDAETIASNAKLYNGEGSDVAKAAVDLARRITAALTGNSMHAEEEADESEEEDGVAISDASDEEVPTAEHDWDRALPQFMTRPRTKRRRLLGDADIEDASTGTGSGEASEEDAAGGRRSSRVRRPNVRTVDAASNLEPGLSNRHGRFPSRLRATVSRYSPKAEDAEEAPAPYVSLRSSSRLAAHAPSASPEPSDGPEQSAEHGAAPRVRWRWSSRPGSLRSLPPVHDMLRSPRSARVGSLHREAEGDGGLRTHQQTPGSPDGSMRRTQRSRRSTALASPAPDGPLQSAQADRRAPPSLSHATATQRIEPASPAGTSRRSRQRLGGSRYEGAHDSLPSEEQQIEEAIRQSLQNGGEHHYTEVPEAALAASSGAQQGRSGLRIKLRGAQ